jgi:hypothetical protein
MSSKKALFVGCSFTADSGFTPENQPKYHWPHLFCQQTGYQLINYAIGGMSNDEIFCRTSEAIIVDQFDLVVVMWSHIGRRWVYQSEKNVDDFTIINGGVPKGFQNNSEYTKTYAKLHYSFFDNSYVNTKHWLLKCLALESMLQYKNIPYLFIKGFDNNITALNSASYCNGFYSIDALKSMLDFDNRPDNYILTKLNVLKQLVGALDQTHWLNLTTPSFRDMRTDVADDLEHPGRESNRELSDNLVKFFKGLNEQSIS